MRNPYTKLGSLKKDDTFGDLDVDGSGIMELILTKWV